MNTMKIAKRILFLAAVLTSGFPVQAADEGGPLPIERDRIERFLGRLELTDSQKESVEPILQDSFEKRRAVLEAHGIWKEPEERPNFREMKKVRKEVEAIRKETDAKLGEILTSDQMDELRDARDKVRKEMKQRFKERRKESEN